ncbi:hypothetical protein VTK26DRAFT_3928 [Humicola hyalothermophila]
MHLTRPPSYACDTIAIAITNAMAIFPDDCLPPEGFFETREALYQSINANIATSRTEGIYALLKSYLRRSTLDLFNV